MQDNVKSYLIYKSTNIETGMIYVGVTTKNLESRIKDHIQKSNSNKGHYFQEAIGTYGPEAFNWEEIDTTSSRDELAQIEKQYIEQYNSYRNGYNSDSGGGFKKTVYQYSIDDGTLTGSFDCLESAASAVNADKKAISRACLNVNNIYKGFYWSYEYKEPFIPNSDARRKEVIQMDVEGNMIAEYKSVAEASQSTGANRSSIAKCCRGKYKSASGFIWKYKQ
ncbi:NUMOD1 domain-containing DNA-binding protein [Altibacter sp. HG106]|uniref:NUMOD1 domain-containing DNA-binding protein n=1 Tax=Altibacter sp. HG106 TaxID=3023937 RepID=UPI0023509FEC|nr:NUMOD1 domain-containing DNA-binding protein [Altibacter sp. HG106]MDC7994039.1 GIY-YIG nuclease family protein [Altibacter sp. HG106]